MAEATEEVMNVSRNTESEGEPGAAPEPGSGEGEGKVKGVAELVEEPGEGHHAEAPEKIEDPNRKPIPRDVPEPRIVNLPEVARTGTSRISGHKLQRDIKIESRPSDFDEDPPSKVVDLCLIMDCTGSMSAWIKHCKDTLHDVIDDSMEEDEGSAVRVAFVGYRDFCDKFLYDIMDFTYLDAEMKTFISKRKAKGGGDAPEDIQGALFQALNLSWREDSIKVCFLVADAPCHGKKYHRCNDDYPNGNPHGLVLEELVKEFSDREIAFTCYKLTNETETMYSIMEKAYEEGKEKDGFEFIDIRGQIKGSRPLHHAAPPVALMSGSRAAPVRRTSGARLLHSCEEEMYEEASMDLDFCSSSVPRSAPPPPRASGKRAKKSLKSKEMGDLYSAVTRSNLRMQKAKFRSRKGW